MNLIPTTLTINNFKRLVEDSLDLWIILIFDENIAPETVKIWNKITQKYEKLVKFSGINVSQQGDLLKKLKLTSLPTVFSMNEGVMQDQLILNSFSLNNFNHSSDLSNQEEILLKFVIHSLNDSIHGTYFPIIKANLNNETNGSSALNLYLPSLSDIKEVPLLIRIIKLYPWIDIFQYENNLSSQSMNGTLPEDITNQMNNINSIVQIDQYDSEKNVYNRRNYSWSKENYSNGIIDFIKFNTIYEINKKALNVFCGEEENWENLSEPKFCIFIVKNSSIEVIYFENNILLILGFI